MSAARQGGSATTLQADGTAVVAGGSIVPATDLYGFATVKTDASDYAPGTPVNITGAGWVPGETVTLSLLESPYYDTHPAITTVADANGSIANSDFAPDLHDLNIRFYLTALGSQSQAYNTFTDSTSLKSVAVTGSQSPNPIVSGGAATYTIAVGFNGNNSSCTANLTVSGLPAGASGSFSPSSVTSTDGSDKSSTLTVATTFGVTLPSGSTPYSFTVTATACQPSGKDTANGSGTLAVIDKTAAVFSSLTASQTITYGQGSVSLSGNIGNAGSSVVPQ
jgi:hypothetical protein